MSLLPLGFLPGAVARQGVLAGQRPSNITQQPANTLRFVSLFLVIFSRYATAAYSSVQCRKSQAAHLMPVAVNSISRSSSSEAASHAPALAQYPKCRQPRALNGQAANICGQTEIQSNRQAMR